jgi:hypothetical protein
MTEKPLCVVAAFPTVGWWPFTSAWIRDLEIKRSGNIDVVTRIDVLMKLKLAICARAGNRTGLFHGRYGCNRAET